MLLRRSTKRAAHRLLGDERYAAVQSRYWRSRLRRLRYAYEFREEIASTVSPGDTVLDVGANVGQYAALLAAMVGPEGRVLAFEPVPRTFCILGSVVAGLGLSNVDTVQLALADFDGTAPFKEVWTPTGFLTPGWRIWPRRPVSARWKFPSLGSTHSAMGRSASIRARS